MAGLSILRRLLMKQAMKENAPFQNKGIMSISKSLSGNVDTKLRGMIRVAEKQGVDLNKLSEQEIKYMLELNKPRAPVVLSNEEAYEFLNKFLKQGKGKKGEVIKFPKDKIKDIDKAKSRFPETEIIGGIQTTRGLGDVFPKQVEKTVTVRTVIEDIKKLEPIESMKETNRVLRGEGKYKNLSKADREKIAGDESVTDHIFERNIIDETEDFAYGGVAGLLGERPGYNEGKTAKKSFIKLIPQFTEKGEQIPVFSKTGKQQIEGAPEGITSDKEVFNLIVGLDIPITEKINILGDIGFSKFRDKIEKGDEELFLMDQASNVNKNIGIGYEDDGLSGSIMYNPDTKYKQFQISKKFAQGGPARQNFAMGRRAFMKLLGGVGAGIGALKTGAFKLLGKEAAPVAKEVVKSAGSGTTPPPYFFNLVNKIKTMGDDITTKYETQQRQKITKYKDYELTEDITTGEKTIQKFKLSELDEGPSNMVEETYMNYKPGKGQMDETTKGKTPPDEYTEDTSYIRGDGGNKGGIYKTVDGVGDDVIEEGTMFEDNITDFKPNKLKTKKASGGLAHMVGE